MSINYLLALGFIVFFFLFEFSFLLDRELAMEIYGVLSILCLVFLLMIPGSITVNINHISWAWIAFGISAITSVISTSVLVFADELVLSKKAYIICLIILFLTIPAILISFSATL